MTNNDFIEAAKNFREAKELIEEIPAYILEESEFTQYYKVKDGLWKLEDYYREYHPED